MGIRTARAIKMLSHRVASNTQDLVCRLDVKLCDFPRSLLYKIQVDSDTSRYAEWELSLKGELDDHT